MRLFTIARFGVYAVVIALGVLHLAGRGDAGATEARGPWISGRTSGGHDVVVRLDRARLVAVGMGWHGRCSNGLYLGRQYGSFDELRTGRFERRGRRFRQSYAVASTFGNGMPMVLRGTVEGTAAMGEASGTAMFNASYYDSRGRPATCGSGPIAWSAPR